MPHISQRIYVCAKVMSERKAAKYFICHKEYWPTSLISSSDLNEVTSVAQSDVTNKKFTRSLIDCT